MLPVHGFEESAGFGSPPTPSELCPLQNLIYFFNLTWIFTRKDTCSRAIGFYLRRFQDVLPRPFLLVDKSQQYSRHATLPRHV
jgi:hypothetical protein